MSELKAALYVRGVLLPLTGVQLLLPNAAVSEVVAYREPESPPAQAPNWLLGSVAWREQVVPLVAFERLVGLPRPLAGQKARVAICNTINANKRIPYFGLVLQSIPHLIRITEEGISPHPRPRELGKMVLRQVKVNEELAWIPDLDAIERLLLTVVA